MYILAIDYVIVRDSVDKINEFFDPLNFKPENLPVNKSFPLQNKTQWKIEITVQKLNI